LAKAAQTSPGPQQEYRPVYAIFEGGGAKGITHIGALKALEKENLVVVGAAGSSAGAIIAALVALGYSADELYAEDHSTDILASRGKRPIDLIGRASWWRYRALRLSAEPLVLLLAVALLGAYWKFAPFLLLALLALLRPLAHWHQSRSLAKAAATLIPIAMVAGLWAGLALWLASPGPAVAAGAIAVFCVVLMLAFTWPVFRRRGLFTTGDMGTMLNAILREKLEQHHAALIPPRAAPPERVRFRDIEVPGCVRLKIIVSDARSGELVVFDHSTPDVVIADAVAVSAAIPLVFQPPIVEGASLAGSPIFVDGGLVSNLPAWSFRAEKRALERGKPTPPIPIIALSLSNPELPTPAGAAAPALTSFIAAVIRTGIFGSQRVVENFITDLVVIDLLSPLGTLGFNCSRKQATAAYQAGVDQAGAKLAEQRKIAEATTRVLQKILKLAQANIRKRRKAASAVMPRVRISLVDPVDPGATAFRVGASVGMEADSDDRLELDGRNDVAPRAFRDQLPLLRVLQGRTAKQLVMTKYEHALVCRNVHSVICVPVSNPFEPTTMERVLCLDSTDSLRKEYQDPNFMQLIRSLAVATSAKLIERPIKGPQQ
jgi:NTE family protein